jgi:hypothetical protein
VIVNTRVARLFPLQVLHLLGFRRLVWTDDLLVVTRRSFDTKGPERVVVQPLPTAAEKHGAGTNR